MLSSFASAPRLAARQAARNFSCTSRAQAKKVLLILYDGGINAKQEPRLLGCTENELGIRDFVEKNGYELVTSSFKDGPGNDLDKHIVDSEIVITTPFHPGYLTRERLLKAKDLKLCVTAGIGSDHVDLDTANEKKLGVLEVTGSNVVSVAEHVVMTILDLVRNFVPAHNQIVNGEWNVAEVAKNEFDLEGKVVGTVGAGRIGYRVLERLKPFDCKELLYYDYQGLSPELEKAVGARRCATVEDLVKECDVVTINCPLHAGTVGLFNKELLSKMKPGSWLVNTARGAICVAEDVADAVKSGQLRGYGGDVWNVQPSPKDHPWRTMEHPYGRGAGNAMVPHMSGTSLDAQQRYATGVRNILQSYFSKKEDYRPQDVICYGGHYGTKAYGSEKKVVEKK